MKGESQSGYILLYQGRYYLGPIQLDARLHPSEWAQFCSYYSDLDPVLFQYLRRFHDTISRYRDKISRHNELMKTLFHADGVPKNSARTEELDEFCRLEEELARNNLSKLDIANL